MEQEHLTPKQIDHTILMVGKHTFFASVWVTLFVPTSIFLIGFLQNMGASVWHIGLLSSLTLFFQAALLPGSYIFEKYGNPRNIAVKFISFAMFIRFFIGIVPFLFFDFPSDFKILIVFVILFTSVAINVSGSAPWVPWISSIIPSENLGKFWAKQNMIAMFVVGLTTIIASKILDVFNNNITFLILFTVGTFSGLASVQFIKKIPQTRYHSENVPAVLDFLRLPFKDNVFRKFIFYLMFWSFARSVTLGFGILYMLDILKMSYFHIGLYTTIGTIVAIFAFGFWGHLADEFGNKPIIYIASVVLGATSFLWLLNTPNFLIFIPVIFILDAIANPAHAIAWATLQIKYSPKKQKSIYLSFAAICAGISGGFAPLLAGILAQSLDGWSFSMRFYTVYNLHILFIISTVLTFISIFGLKAIEEKTSSSASILLKAIFSKQGLDILKTQVRTVIKGFGIGEK